MYYPSIDQVRELAKTANLIPIYREVSADLETPVSAYLKIARGPYSFLLESVEGAERIARYSFIGTEPYKVIRTGVPGAAPGRSEEGDWLVDYGAINPLGPLEEELSKFSTATVAGLPRFLGGAVGYMGYETVAYFERLPSPDKDVLGVPEAVFMLTDTLVVFDHRRHTMQIVSHVHRGEDLRVSYRQAVDKIDEIVTRLQVPLGVPESVERQPQAASVNSNMTPAEHEAMVKKAKEYIIDGDVIQAVLAQRFSRPTNVSPFDLYRAVRTVNPSPYQFYLDLGDFQLVGASPETQVKVENGRVDIGCIAGTRPRGTTEEEDEALENELLNDEKERAEHVMLVDLARNDIGRVCGIGTVKVEELMVVERYSHVMHLVSYVTGRLQSGRTCFDAFRSGSPLGTVSGAPKIRAMEIIAELEPDKRGPYAGAVGYFDFSGNMDTCVALRTMLVKDGMAYVEAGGGIVYDSVAEMEFRETQHKAGALLRAIDEAESMAQWIGSLQDRTAE